MNIKNKLSLAAVIAITAFGGGLVGSAIKSERASAADPSPTNSATTAEVNDPSVGGHVGANGVKEELLTGDNATKAREAALKAVPGATILRVETDAEGSPYEAHTRLPDGSEATIKFDSNFNITSTESGKR